MLFSDIDECSLGVCAHSCTNTDGGYTCGCPTGYELQSDGRTCATGKQIQ